MIKTVNEWPNDSATMDVSGVHFGEQHKNRRHNFDVTTVRDVTTANTDYWAVNAREQ